MTRLTIRAVFLFLLILQVVFLFVQPFNLSLGQTSVSNQQQKAYSQSLIPTQFTGIKNVTTFTGPDSASPTVISYLQSAKHSIHIEIYAISSYFLIQEIFAAKVRNASMDISVLISYNHASSFDRANTFGSAYNLSQAGIPVYLSNNSYTFTHAKFWIIDGISSFIYTGNWAKTSVPPDNSYGNREWGIVANDLEVSQYYEEVFALDLSISTEYVPDPSHEKEMTLNIQTSSYSAPFTAQTYVELMTLQPIFTPDNAKEVIRSLLQSANTSILVEQQYIKTEWGLTTNEFLQDLIDAKNRGIEVKVIVEGRSSDAVTLRSVLLSEGIPLVYLDTKLEWCHTKGIIIDGKVTIISSINWSYQSVYSNRESGLVIYSTSVTNFYDEVFNYDWEHGTLQGSSSNSGTSSSPSSNPSFELLPFLIIIIVIIIIIVGGVAVYYVFILPSISLERD